MKVGIDPSLSCTGISDGQRSEVIKTVPGDGTTAQNNLRRVDEIIDAVYNFIIDYIPCGEPIELWVEGPMLNPHGASHLYDVGWLYSEIYRVFSVDMSFPIHEIQPTTLKKFLTGKGNTPKDQTAAIAEQVHGVTFEKDAGLDKLHAWGLVKYGEAVANGEIEYTAPLRRGLKQKLRKRKIKASVTAKRSRGTTSRQQANKRGSTTQQ